MDKDGDRDVLMILASVLIPILSGAILLILKEKFFDHKKICIYTGTILAVWILVVFKTVFTGQESFVLLSLNDELKLGFAMDDTGRIFAMVMSIVWTLAGYYSFEYMKHEESVKRFFGFYLMAPGALMGLCFSANLFTYYAFYEFMTLLSFALVLHNGTRQALMAALKYLFYSFAGAYMVLFGLYFVYRYADDPTCAFSYGGIIDMNSAPGGIMTVSMLLMILGFSVKAGMFPMHGWLPTAHPVAPSPASAVLSGIIVKAGVLGIIRVIFYIFGSDTFSGSTIQTVCLILSLVTVFMGSMLAYREKVLKKRLAYSTVSQISYILFGIFMMDPVAYEGAILHVAAHACIKCVLFLCAGSIIYVTGCTRVDELRGIGKKMPVMMWCFTIASLGLIGIPPLGGFTSKWFLCVGALKAGIPVFSVLGPAILLVSALLTAGYLLPVSVNAFLPGDDFETKARTAELTGSAGSRYHAYSIAKEPSKLMLIPMIILTVLSVLIGMFPEVLL